VISVILSAAILAAGAPAAEPTTVAPAVATASKKAKPEPGDTVCKREQVVGSRMKQRLCMSQADWEARRISARDELDKAQTNMPAPK